MLLNLPGWTIDRTEETARDLLIAVIPPTPDITCQHCGHQSPYGHGSVTRHLADLPIRKKRVRLVFDQPRYRCRNEHCRRTFTLPLPEVDESHNMTVRLREHILEDIGPRPYSHIAEEVGLSEGTIRNLAASAEQDRPTPETPRVLGIDELYLGRRHRCILTNIEAGTVLDMLSGRTYRQLLAHISAMPERQRIELVTIDMHRPYLTVAQAALRGATAIVDKYHVVSMANLALDQVRIALRREMPDRTARILMRSRFLLLRRLVSLSTNERMILETWLDQLPQLRHAHAAKEAFFEIYDTATDAKTAGDQLAAWRESLNPNTARAFRELLTAAKNWEPHILAYFDHRYTNAATEAINGIAKLINKMGRGYSFRSIRTKILFTAGVRKQRLPIFSRTGWEDDRMGMVIAEPIADYGADISTLRRMLEDGRL